MKNFILGFLLAAVICMGFFCYTYYTEVKSFKESINSLQTQINEIVEEKASEVKEEKKKVTETEEEPEVEEDEDEAEDEEETTEKTGKKKSINRLDLAKAFEKIVRDSYKKDNGSTYAVVDIDNDGAEELLILTGDSEAEKMVAIYTYDEKASDCGEIGGGNSVLYDMNKKDYLLRVNAHMGFETLYSVELKDGKIVEKELSSNEVSSEEEYSTGDVEIEFTSCKDDSVVAGLSEDE